MKKRKTNSKQRPENLAFISIHFYLISVLWSWIIPSLTIQQEKKTKKAGVPECHLSIPLKDKKKKCNLVLEILTSFTKILHYLKDKKIWMELLNNNKKPNWQTNFKVFLLPHGVIHAKKSEKRPRSIIFSISKAAWPKKFRKKYLKTSNI